MSFVRDAEIEALIRDISTPLFRAGGLVAESVSIHLVLDKSLNAFVANGQRMFIHTGLLMQADDVGQVIGVIAHETGHISGGHLSRLGRAFDQGATTTVLSAILGAATAIGTGRGDVGVAVFAGGQTIAQRNFFSFTRAQEASADQAALTLLDQTGQSARGLLTFMEKLRGQELLISDNQDPYVRTHPLSEDRIETIAAHIDRSPHSDALVSPEIEARFERAKAKIRGYVDPPQQTFRIYPETDQSIAARYARAFAYSKVPDASRAIDILDELLVDVPNDPYFLELKGQVLLESQDVRGAIDAFRLAVDNAPNSALIQREFARALLASDLETDTRQAIEMLEAAVNREPRVASSWRQLGIAYGRLGDIGRSSLALAESALLNNKTSEVQFHAGRAAEMFPRGSPEWLQAQDLLIAARAPEAQSR